MKVENTEINAPKFNGLKKFQFTCNSIDTFFTSKLILTEDAFTKQLDDLPFGGTTFFREVDLEQFSPRIAMPARLPAVASGTQNGYIITCIERFALVV